MNEGTRNFDGFGYKVCIDKAYCRDEAKIVLWGTDGEGISSHTITMTIEQLKRLLYEAKKKAAEERRRLES
jgi:hypothetical protein